jgi:hypothetical protein
MLSAQRISLTSQFLRTGIGVALFHLIGVLLPEYPYELFFFFCMKGRNHVNKLLLEILTTKARFLQMSVSPASSDFSFSRNRGEGSQRHTPLFP